MTKLILSSLLILFSSISYGTATKAEVVNEAVTQTLTEEVQQKVKQQDTTISSKTEPFNLFSSAYQGKYEEQGVPAFGELYFAYITEKITAKKLVMIAIENGNLAPEVAEDEGYIGAVDLYLQGLEDN